MNLRGRRWFVPEVVQTSAMDCGPAALKCLVEGFGIAVNYGRLREACQTEVDGTSIDTVEEVAGQLGLSAEQIMVPGDFVLSREAQVLPCIAVVTHPNGVTHFVVVWRKLGRWLQIMDPGVGRHWISTADFLSKLYVHVMAVPASSWCEWARSEKFTRPVTEKLLKLEISQGTAAALVSDALGDASWRSLALLDAGTRTTGAMVRSGVLRKGREAQRVIERLVERPGGVGQKVQESIPAEDWSVWEAPAEGGEERLFFRGAVLVHASGRREQAAEPAPTPGGLPSDISAALSEKSARPGLELLRMLRKDGWLAPMAMVGALGLAALAVMIQAVLFRSLLVMPREFGLSGHRLAVMAALLLFALVVTLLELPTSSGLLRMGRHLEARFRVAFLEKIPRLGDRYFHSRLTSDMADRSHNTHRIRQLPSLGGELVRAFFELGLTVLGIFWLDPVLALPAALAGVLAVALPMLMQPALTESDLRVANHAGALSRFYLDALLGLIPARTHGGERALRREQESLLVEWARASFGLQKMVARVESLQALTGFALAAWLMFAYVSRSGEVSGALLLVYWSLNIPALGEEIAQAARQYPWQRNATLRLLEPLGTPDEQSAVRRSVSAASTGSYEFGHTSSGDENGGPGQAEKRRQDAALKIDSIRLDGVTLRAAGHTILEDVSLHIAPGEHVAIVGPSGAGKSSLLGLLLGWYRAAQGEVRVSGERLECELLNKLRAATAWVDPAVQLWNRSLLENLRYGNGGAVPDTRLLEDAALRQLLENLQDGLQTELGESGALVSGGEGQRVRFGRALLRPGVQLALLDEPFRGLDRETRRHLLDRARMHWQDATLLCVTHDVSETLTFPRVLVIEAGKIVQDGCPQDLALQTDSRYSALLEAERQLHEGLWSSGAWRQLRLESGHLREVPARPQP
jgi:ABC-type bacteriocin/lantibiotic exporter with double-glycine peptidase domain